KTQGANPDGLARRPRRSTRARHGREKGSPRNLGDPGTSSQDEPRGRAKAKPDGGDGKSERRIGVRTPGNRPEGPGRAKGGARRRNRARDRWRRHRARRTSQRNSNG